MYCIVTAKGISRVTIQFLYSVPKAQRPYHCTSTRGEQILRVVPSISEAMEKWLTWLILCSGLTVWVTLLYLIKQEFVRPRWPYDMRPSARAEKYMCVIVIH